MRLEFSDEGGQITLHLYADNTNERVTTVFKDTDHGNEVKTTVTNGQGETRVITDKTDRTTPPLHALYGLIENLAHAFSVNAQSALNRQRYQRLRAEGGPITVQRMCMDGLHTGEEYADIPFKGGIVGVTDVDEPEPKEPESRVQLSDKLEDDLRGLLGGD